MPERLAICRLDPAAPFPAWVLHEGAALFSVTRTPDETSIVCAEDDVPPAVVRVERGWRALAVAGPIPFDAVGVIASITEPLAAHGVPVFVISTYDTDLVLVRAVDLPRAIEALRPGFTIEDPAAPPSAFA
ncbi:MAG: ACT domain-containing protein [Candidatus Eisenbacteria bacterium]|nr:ACT domain-containing protein [Candidatus Eisenbacteria bacterium]